MKLHHSYAAKQIRTNRTGPSQPAIAPNTKRPRVNTPQNSPVHQIAAVVAKEAFQQGLIIELCGPKDEVLKCLPPLVIEENELTAGLEIIRHSIHKAVR